MKNLMIYISPTGSFDNPNDNITGKLAGQLAKIQIENSIQLGWKKQDIMLITNFNWQYGSIKAKFLKDFEFNDKLQQTGKINALIKLFEKGTIKDKEIYWFHDLMTFQQEKITEMELGFGKADVALTDNGKKTGWDCSSIFFKKGSYNIFEKIKEIMYQDETDEEKSLYKLTQKDKNIGKRIKKLNETYNFTPFNLKSSYKITKKPLKVLNFGSLTGLDQPGVESVLKFYLGENKFQTAFVTQRLARIFKYHRIG